MQNTFTLHLNFVPLEGKPYPYIFTINDDDGMDAFLTQRQHLRDKIITLLSEFKAVFIIDTNNENYFKITVQQSYKNKLDFLVMAASLQKEITFHPIKLTSQLIRDETFVEATQVVMNQLEHHPVRHAHIFFNDELKIYFAYYTDHLITIPVHKYNVTHVTSAGYVFDDNYTTVTTYGLSGDIDEVYNVIDNIMTMHEKFDTLTRIPMIDQDLTEQRKSELDEDIYLKQNLLYKFEKGDEHAIRVLEHSVLHHRKPYVLIHEPPLVYVYIGDTVVDFVESMKGLKENAFYAVSQVYVRDVSGLKVEGFGLMAEHPLPESTLNVILHGLISGTSF